MPRPKVDRVNRSMRLPAELDAAMVNYAEAHGLSVNQLVEQAVRALIGCSAARQGVGQAR